jgi:hypothetical protein
MKEYVDVLPLTREAAVKAFASGQADRICPALVAVAFHEPDWRWAQERCLELIGSEDPDVSGLAATCLGHVARIHRILDMERVRKALHSRIQDPLIAGRILDALDDIEMFAHE